MPIYTYKCFSCMKSFSTNRLYQSVHDGGICPRCSTLITRVNLQYYERDRHADFMNELNGMLINEWITRMRSIDQYMEDRKSGGFAFKQVQPKDTLVTCINDLEKKMAQMLDIKLKYGNRRIELIQALKNPLVNDQFKQVRSNNRPLLVFRFFTGNRDGLLASSQGAIGQGDAQPVWNPNRTRGTVTLEAKNHQRGKKKSNNNTGRRSDVVSLTCSMRNLVRCSAGAYPCTPGGQVVPIIFGDNHMPVKIERVSRMWAPKVTLIMIPAGSYICDWTDHLTDISSDSTSKDVSFFEREIIYDTWGGNYSLASEYIIGVWDNPFRGQVEVNKRSMSNFRSFGSFSNNRRMRPFQSSPMGLGGLSVIQESNDNDNNNNNNDNDNHTYK